MGKWQPNGAYLFPSGCDAVDDASGDHEMRLRVVVAEHEVELEESNPGDNTRNERGGGEDAGDARGTHRRCSAYSVLSAFVYRLASYSGARSRRPRSLRGGLSRCVLPVASAHQRSAGCRDGDGAQALDAVLRGHGDLRVRRRLLRHLLP